MSDADAPSRRDRQDRARDQRKDRTAGLDTPRTRTGPRLRLRPDVDPESFGRGAERFARFMGTARFLVYMSAFVTVWLLWNTLAPTEAQFDPEALNYTLLTLILSLQASYAAPLILLAQNRQADRDRVQNAQDRVAGERALADTEFLTREVADLKIALREVATRDFLRSELRTLLEEIVDRQDEDGSAGDGPDDPSRDRPRDRSRERPRDGKRGKGKEKDKRDKRADRPEAPAHTTGPAGDPVDPSADAADAPDAGAPDLAAEPGLASRGADPAEESEPTEPAEEHHAPGAPAARAPDGLDQPLERHEQGPTTDAGPAPEHLGVTDDLDRAYPGGLQTER